MPSRLFKISIFIISLMPAVALIYGLLNDQLGANPIEALTRDTGEWALRFLLITLAVSPLRLVFSWHFLAPIRRMLGLYSFFYASVHMLLYVWLDQFFSLGDIIDDIIERPFITIGVINFLALIPLAVTSNDAMIKRLGAERWNRLHSLVYYIAIGGVVHFFMLVKKDITEPVIYIAILAVLLGIRLYRYGRRTFISA
ncbi:MAG: sulfoxide reductase heme-binding subunit YedZ [Candidatus Endobugula sp.]|jgi:sulfoxide reductase heme-binding subunit YedZ